MNAVAPLTARHADGRNLFLRAFAGGCRPRRVLSVSEWADAHRWLSAKASSEAGRWNTARTPYLREIMDSLSVRSQVKRVTFIKSTQVGGTEAGLNFIGYVIDHVPAPMLVVVPTIEVRRRWVQQRLVPLLSETEVLADKVNASRTRDGSNTQDIKDFPGGILVLGGANSPASLASMPIRFVLNDEVDRFPWQVGGEGDPLGLIRERQKTFPRRKEFNVSTPTMKEASRIEELYEASDQRRYHMPCPHCSELITFRWGNLRWNKALTHAWYICEQCGSDEIYEHHKPSMLAAGRWIAANPEVRDHRGYHINALYAPIGLGDTWLDLAREFMACKNDRVKLKRFVNTKLGETWEDRSRDLKPHKLMERAEPYRLRQVPPGCLILTAGVDTQPDRLHVNVVGWGRDEVCWLIDRVELPGDPSLSPLWHGLIHPALQGRKKSLQHALEQGGPAGSFRERLRKGLKAIGCSRVWLTEHVGRRAADLMDMTPAEWPGDVWLDLVEILNTPLLNHHQRELWISVTAIDTGGHNTHDVYNFVRSRPARRVMAIKGSNVPNKPIIAGAPKPQDVNWRGKTIKQGVQLWTIGTDTAKHMLFNRLAGDEQLDAGSRKIHFSEDLPVEYYDQLTAETFDPEKNKWVKRRGRRNEDLDTWVYACAAAHHPQVRINAMRPREWAQLEAALEPAERSPGSADQSQAASTEPAAAPEKPKPNRKKRRNGGGGGFGRDDWKL